MKKLLLLFVLPLLLLNSCSSDDDSGYDTLDGTIWISEGTEDGFSYKSTISFQESTYIISGYEIFDDSKYESTSTGTYTYKHPNVTLIDDAYPTPETFKISGNKLGVGNDIVWTKK